jgi:precorrin-2 dehydrogenase/sirohydrochlorin ferrochelatase
MADYYPAFLDLRNRRCVVIGAGQVGEHKGRQLLASGAIVSFVSPEATDGVREMANKGEARWQHRFYQRGDLADAFLAIAATNDEAVNQQIRDEATESRVVLNVVDDPPRCDFIAPAVVERGPVIVAVSTSGTSPALARKLREGLERWPGMDWAEASKPLSEARRELKAMGVHASPDAWQQAMDDELLTLVRAGRHQEAVSRLVNVLAGTARVHSS